MHDRTDVYTRITYRIVAAIEAGTTGEFRLPWHQGATSATRPINVQSGKAYRGVNVLALWAAACIEAYPSGLWGTYRQWQALGAQVRQGEHGSLIVFWKDMSATREPEAEAKAAEGESTAEPHGSRRLLARGYVVFNAAQVDGYTPPAPPVLPEAERDARAERFFTALAIPTVHSGDRAFYRPSTDTVHLPAFAAFEDATSAYAVRAHECAHAVGAPHRLGRDLSGRFGSQAYAMEELVAQLAAAFVLADLGLANEPRPEDAAYIASWLAVLRGDPCAIFIAASQAQAAVDWMHAQQGSADKADAPAAA
jgi:antirestriction protein ArdC